MTNQIHSDFWGCYTNGYWVEAKVYAKTIVLTRGEHRSTSVTQYSINGFVKDSEVLWVANITAGTPAGQPFDIHFSRHRPFDPVTYVTSEEQTHVAFPNLRVGKLTMVKNTTTLVTTPTPPTSRRSFGFSQRFSLG